MSNPHEEKINASTIYDIAMGAQITQCLYVVSKLGIADLLAKNGNSTAADLAKQTNSHPTALLRVLTTLVEKGIFTEEEIEPDYQQDQSLPEIKADQFQSSKVTRVKFGLTGLSRALLSDTPYSVRNVCLMLGDPSFYLSTGKLLETVQTGKPGFEIVHQTGTLGMYEHFAKDERVAHVYHDCMEQLCALGDSALLFSYNFSSYKILVDVGGGSGALLSRILKKNPEAKGILFDSVSALSSANNVFLGKASVSKVVDCKVFNENPKSFLETNQCTLVSGDFLTEMPEGADCYILKNIFMDLELKTCIEILKQITKVMKDNTKVIIIQSMVPVNNQPNTGRLNDLISLTTTTGCGTISLGEREYRQVFELAGMQWSKKVDCLADQTIVEAVKKV